MRILIFEDDEPTGNNLIKHLFLEDYACDWVDELESSETALASHNYDMLIIDADHNQYDALNVLQQIRQHYLTLPIIIISSNDQVAAKVHALNNGADDYICKPFDTDELIARIRALKRRSLGNARPTLCLNNIELDPSAKTVKKSGKKIILGAKEFAILRTLMEKPGHIISKTQIEDTMYGWDDEIASNTIEVHIHGLRQKLGKQFIKTIRHSGYMVEQN